MRRLSLGEHALLVLAHLRNGTYHRLAAGFWGGVATVYRVRTRGGRPTRRVARKAFVILEGTLRALAPAVLAIGAAGTCLCH